MTAYAVDLDELESVIARMASCQRDLAALVVEVAGETDVAMWGQVG